MSKLIHLKHRMKALRVIKKITHAMRLISMSSHTKLRKNITTLQLIKQEITPILCQLYKKHPESHLMNEDARYDNLYIIIGSEKGLCGNFNNLLYSYIDNEIDRSKIKNSHFIVIGKKAKKYFEEYKIPMLLHFDKIQASKTDEIAVSLFELVEANFHLYKSISCIYNNPKTFFTVDATKTILVPVQPESCETNDCSLDEYVWIQPEKEVVQMLFKILLKTNILTLLTSSMIAEQSSRFLSMDSSTRNADNLLKVMNLEYNKARQARITKEIIELIGSF